MAAVVVPLGPAVVDITGVRAGDRNLVTLTLTSGGAPLNLTGMVVTSQVRKLSVDPDPPALVAEVTVTDAPGGKVSVRWVGDDVREILNGAAAWEGVWDVQVASGTADPLTVAAGKWAAEMDVTR